MVNGAFYGVGLFEVIAFGIFFPCLIPCDFDAALLWDDGGWIIGE
jgi:hypothetical protein